MSEAGGGIARSELDTRRWGVSTAKGRLAGEASVEAAMEAARAQALGLLIVRCDADDAATTHALERAGFLLMDTLLHFRAPLAPPGDPKGARASPARPFEAGEELSIRDLARRIFHGYRGHYHADPRLDRARCDEVYADWAHRSCVLPEVADEVLVVADAGELVAFATLRVATPADGEGVLFGVAEEAQGRGLYRALMEHGMAYLAGRGCAAMHVSTQLSNRAVQRVWTRLGFDPTRAEHTFHRWLP